MKIVKCVSNENYILSLTVGKEYVIIADDKAKDHDRIRVIDNTDESYLYPISLFEQRTAM